ncbi:MAG: aspartate carbamoyltransferase catalytic subunit [Rickettsiales bacterium]|nr:aspartate carbamoyltransferase catalytic subunit [Rickettsiales bacterium]
MKDLISIDQLRLEDIIEIHNRAEKFLHLHDEENKKNSAKILQGKILVNFFFENSTRTRTSFEIAAKRLGAEVINIDISLSSLKKGESIIDTAKTINAMKPDFVAIRHNSSGILHLLKKHISASLINAGDGTNEHPSQALLDSFVIKQHKKNFKNLKVAICGDVLHSRVARSNIKLLKKLGCEIRVITPPTLITRDYRNWLKENWNIEVFEILAEGISGVDVIMMLRIQQERMLGCYIPSLSEYFKLFGLTHQKLQTAKNDVLVLHPGPINREVEISSSLADDEKYSLILEQVEAGVAVRQAILKFLS